MTTPLDRPRLVSVLRGTLTIVVIVLAVVAALWALQRRLIYLPSQAVPSDVPAGVEVVRYPTADDLELEAWYLPAPGVSRGAVIVFNGNAGNRSDRLPLAQALAESGYSSLLVDYRGYGGNPGSPSEDGLVDDARAALAYLRSRPDVDPDRIVYFGESLGSGVAVHLAAEDPPAALILRSPFTSLADVGATHYPFLPVSLLLRDRYPNVEKIRNVRAPLLVIAGSDDRIVPTDLSRRLFEAAFQPKELLTIEGARHNDFALLSGEEMIDTMMRFLDNHLR